MTFRYNLRENRERDLFGRDRANIQADGGAHALQSIFVSTCFAEFIKHDVCAPLAANHADVVRVGIDGCL